MFFDNIRIIINRGNFINNISSLPLCNPLNSGSYAGISSYAYELAAGYISRKKPL